MAQHGYSFSRSIRFSSQTPFQAHEGQTTCAKRHSHEFCDENNHGLMQGSANSEITTWLLFQSDPTHSDSYLVSHPVQLYLLRRHRKTNVSFGILLFFLRLFYCTYSSYTIPRFSVFPSCKMPLYVTMYVTTTPFV